MGEIIKFLIYSLVIIASIVMIEVHTGNSGGSGYGRQDAAIIFFSSGFQK